MPNDTSLEANWYDEIYNKMMFAEQTGQVVSGQHMRASLPCSYWVGCAHSGEVWTVIIWGLHLQACVRPTEFRWQLKCGVEMESSYVADILRPGQ